MTGYTKLFQDIVTSTIWGEDDTTRIVWITMLALKDRNHFVSASLPGLARQANVKLEDCARAVKKLESKDEFSRSKEHEGRRIKAADGGWVILNGEKYRQKMSADDRREYQRGKQAEYRLKKKGTERERRFVAAVNRGDEPAADRICAEDL